MTNQNPPLKRRTSNLYKNPTDKKIGGVASGVAEYFDLDTTLVRAIWAVSVLAGGFGLLLYVVLWVVLDDDPAALAASAAPPRVEPAIMDVPAPESRADGTVFDSALDNAQLEG